MKSTVTRTVLGGLAGILGLWTLLPAVQGAPPKPLTARELREDFAALAGSVWIDVDLPPGRQGQLWMLGKPTVQGKKVVNRWYMADRTGLPPVGTWTIQEREMKFFAVDGTLIAEGKYEPDEHRISGHYVNIAGIKTFGRFELHRETQRPYRILKTEK